VIWASAEASFSTTTEEAHNQGTGLEPRESSGVEAPIDRNPNLRAQKRPLHPSSGYHTRRREPERLPAATLSTSFSKSTSSKASFRAMQNGPWLRKFSRSRQTEARKLLRLLDGYETSTAGYHLHPDYAGCGRSRNRRARLLRLKGVFRRAGRSWGPKKGAAAGKTAFGAKVVGVFDVAAFRLTRGTMVRMATQTAS